MFAVHWKGMFIMMKRKLKAFTLVEIIVVLIMIAILASLLVPSLIGYIDKANGAGVLLETKDIYTAAQTALSESYGKYGPIGKTSFYSEGEYGNNNASGSCGRVTDYMMYYVQQKNTPSAEKSYLKSNPDKATEFAIAKQVLILMDSYNSSPNQYKFSNSHNPLGMNVDDYQNSYKQPGILIAYNSKGQLLFVQFGRDGYIATVTRNTASVEKDGKFSIYPDEKNNIKNALKKK